MLSPEETLALIERAQNNDEDAKAELLQNNIPLIKSIVRRYQNKQIEYEDLLQLGTLGFIKAVNNFDASFGVRFSTYAVPMIAGEIKRYIRDNGAIKVSRSLKAQNQVINVFIEEYRQKNSRDPSVKEIADYMKIEESDVVFIMDSARYPVSIHAEKDEDGLSLEDKLCSKENQDDYIEKVVLREAIDSFDERDKKIIFLRYYRDKTQSEIAKELGVSQVQVSRLEAKILDRLKKELA
ncbi:MAG: SigB/SigF/SigG family RNA polymerase sigma factor [Clostridiales bacterium]|nr:SigB/SigF/SigG family RNA polymerase sigma factor [Clostridiales bacterium]